MTLFKFNPPGVEAPKKEEANSATATSAQEETPAPVETIAPPEPPSSVEPSAPVAPPAPVSSSKEQATQAPPRVPPEEPRREMPSYATKTDTFPPKQPPRRPPLSRPAPEPPLATGSFHKDPSAGKNALIITLVSIVLVTAALGLYVYLGQKPPAATGEITRMWIYPVQVKSQSSLAGNTGTPGAIDEVLILAKVRLHNQSKYPLYLSDINTTMKQSDGETQTSAASATDFEKSFQAFPKMRPMQDVPLRLDRILMPGEDREGLILSHYTLNKEAWEKRQGIYFTVLFRYQKPLLLEPPNEVEIIQ